MYVVQNKNLEFKKFLKDSVKNVLNTIFEENQNNYVIYLKKYAKKSNINNNKNKCNIKKFWISKFNVF